MVKKFTYEEHLERMRKALAPPTPVSPLAEKIRMAVRKRKLPKLPRLGV